MLNKYVVFEKGLGGVKFLCVCDDEAEAEKFILENPKREYKAVRSFGENPKKLVVSYDLDSCVLTPYGVVENSADPVIAALGDYTKEAFVPIVIPVLNGSFADYVKNTYYSDTEEIPDSGEKPGALR